MSLTLYQFPLSHFCEKVRWALEYKALTYTKKNLIPGAHLKVTTKLAEKSSVPVLAHDDKIIQGSSKIISYLDEYFPDKKLSPVNAQASQAAMEWERYLDQEVGVHVRRYFYHTVLNHRGLTIRFLTDSGPLLAKPLLWLAYGKLEKRMRKFMDINDATAAVSKQHIQKALRRINETLTDKQYLAGDYFSRADLTASALLAPLFRPAKYQLNWPQQWPEPMQSEIDAMAEDLQWAQGIYQQYR